MKNIAVYSRKSCITDKGESIQNQINMCKDYIFNRIDKPENCNLIFYKDEGFSAKNTDRPEFKKMILDAENKKFSHIVCYRLDRISRNVSDFSRLVEKFNKINVSFICVKEQFDTSVPMGRAMMYMASVFAQLERETIAERVKDNMIMLSKRGQWLGGTTPLGMRSHKLTAKDSNLNSKHKFYLKENPTEIEIVKKIYSEFLKFHSLTKTKQYLDSFNLKSRLGKDFSIPSIKKILTNPVYCSADAYARNYFEKLGADVCFGITECNSSLGLIAYNKRNYCEHSGKINNFKSWTIALGLHEGIIEGKNWVKINRILNSNKYIGKSTDSPFARKFICKICHSRMILKHRSSRKNYDYICATKIYCSASECPCKNLNGKKIEKLIYSQIILKGIKSNRFFVKKLKTLKNNLSSIPDIKKTIIEKRRLNIKALTETICENICATFIDKVINAIFWDNTNLEIELKNCN